MIVPLKTIKRMIDTGAAIDITYSDDVKRRPINSTVVFYSVGVNGLNGIMIRDDVTGQLFAVVGRVSNLFILAA